MVHHSKTIGLIAGLAAMLAVALIARGLRGRATYGFRGEPNAP